MPPTVTFGYIDGGYLRTYIRTLAQRYFGLDWLDLRFEDMLVHCEKRFWYDCLPPRIQDETGDEFERRVAPQIDMFERLSLIKGYHVWYGKTAGTGGRARQKGVDVRLAVDMLSHVRSSGVRHMLIATKDADFDPLAVALVQQGVNLQLWSDSSVPVSLKQSVDEHLVIRPESFFGLTTNEFRAKHVPPSAGLSSEWRERGQVVQRGRTKDLRDADIRRLDSGELMLQCPMSPYQWWEFHGPNAEHLKFMAEDHGVMIEWEPVATA